MVDRLNGLFLRSKKDMKMTSVICGSHKSIFIVNAHRFFLRMKEQSFVNDKVLIKFTSICLSVQLILNKQKMF